MDQQTFHIYILIFALAFALGGCGTHDTNKNANLTPMPIMGGDPSDAQLKQSIQTYLKTQNGPANSRYQFHRVDLNDDGLREGVVLFTLPHHYWCGAGGCTLSIFQATKAAQGFTPKSEIRRVRAPIVISTQRTNGWRDIVTRVSGIQMPDHNVALKFDGHRYPGTPTTQSAIPERLIDVQGLHLFE